MKLTRDQEILVNQEVICSKNGVLITNASHLLEQVCLINSGELTQQTLDLLEKMRQHNHKILNQIQNQLGD